MPTDALAQIRALRDDLRALKAQYPELTTPAAKRRLEDYLSTQEETPMPAKGDRTLGENLANLTFKVPISVMDVVEQHLREMQRMSRYAVKIGRSDCLRDIFLRGIDSIEHPTPQFPVVLDAPQLPLPSRPTVEPAAYEARSLTPEVDVRQDERPRRRRVASPLDQAVEDMPLTMEPPAVTEDSAVPDAQTEDVTPRGRRTARPKVNQTVPIKPIKPKRASRAQRGD